MMFSAVDWQSVFGNDIPLLEIFVRGTLVYLGLFIMLRFTLRRQAGGISVTDILVIVVIADAAQNGMSSDYHSVTDGLFLVATIIFWDFTLDWLSYHSPRIGKWLEPSPLLLIKNGRMLRANMRRELITVEDLMGQLREKGVDDIASVRACRMESDGKISVIKKNGGSREI